MIAREPTIQVKTLSIDYWDRREWVNIVKRVSFDIYPGETLGVAGESGCGKSSTAYALFGYRRSGSRFREGQVIFQDKDLLELSERQLQPIRGAHIALVPQNPAGTLTPTMRIGNQLIEAMEAHDVCANRKEARERTVELFREVDLPEPETIGERFPFQLSGGQQQRVITAMALVCNPALVVLDEPTSALDVTTQARILNLLNRLKAEHDMSMVFVSHDLGVLAQICDRVAVMYAGELAEVAPTEALFGWPRHPYTRGLIAAVPRLSERTEPEVRLRGLLRRELLPKGCHFAPRCDHAQPECFEEQQTLQTVGEGHQVACWLWEAVAEKLDGDEGGAT
jgi:peptide/nickel transport system ATP-binding protein